MYAKEGVRFERALSLPFYYSLLQVHWRSKIHFWYNFKDDKDQFVVEKEISTAEFVLANEYCSRVSEGNSVWINKLGKILLILGKLYPVIPETARVKTVGYTKENCM